MTQAWPFIILMFTVAIVFFMSGYLFSRFDKNVDALSDKLEMNEELNNIITDIENWMQDETLNAAVKSGMRRTIDLIQDHRRKYIYEK